MRYGVKLARYDEQIFDTWCWGPGDKRFETEFVSDASVFANECNRRNPKGEYIVREIDD